MQRHDRPACRCHGDRYSPRTKPGNYPEPFASHAAGRVKRPRGDIFGLTRFGVNLTRIAPGAVSSIHHQHLRRDVSIDVLEGCPTLVTEAGPTALTPLLVAGFAEGGAAHDLKTARPEAAGFWKSATVPGAPW